MVSNRLRKRSNKCWSGYAIPLRRSNRSEGWRSWWIPPLTEKPTHLFQHQQMQQGSVKDGAALRFVIYVYHRKWKICERFRLLRLKTAKEMSWLKSEAVTNVQMVQLTARLKKPFRLRLKQYNARKDSLVQSYEIHISWYSYEWRWFIEGGKTIIVPYVYDKTKPLPLMVPSSQLQRHWRQWTRSQENVNKRSRPVTYTTTAKTIKSSEISWEKHQKVLRNEQQRMSWQKLLQMQRAELRVGSITVPYVYRRMCVRPMVLLYQPIRMKKGNELSCWKEIITNQPEWNLLVRQHLKTFKGSARTLWLWGALLRLRPINWLRHLIMKRCSWWWNREVHIMQNVGTWFR